MKKTFTKITGLLAVLAAVFMLAGCNTSLEGTELDYSDEQKEDQGTIKPGSNSGNKAYVTISPTSITKASEDTEFTVTINYYSQLDVKSVESAVNFYTLSDNTTNKYYESVISDTALPKALLDSKLKTTGYGPSEFTFKVDTSSVTTNKIVFVVDAKKLRAKDGALILNENYNGKFGEKDDSDYTIISVSTKNDDSATDSLNSYFRGFYDTYLGSLDTTPDELVDSEGKKTGVYRFTINAPVKSWKINSYGSVSIDEYNNELEAAIGKIYKLEIQEPGSTKWKTADFAFTYHDEDSKEPTTDPYYEHTYTADTPAMTTPGTKWRIVCNKKNTGSVPDSYKEVFSNDTKFYFFTTWDTASTTKVYPTGSNDHYVYVGYGDKDTSFIFGAGSDTDSGNWSYAAAEAAQKTYLSASSVGEDSFAYEVIINTTYEFAAAEDFIVTNSKEDTILDSTKIVHRDADGKIDFVLVKLKNTNVNMLDTKLFVGSGTKLKENTAREKQLDFGYYPEPGKTVTSGYVHLKDARFFGVPYNYINDTSASTDSNKWTFGYVDGSNGNNYGYTKGGPQDGWLLFEAGEYHFELANGCYNSNTQSYQTHGLFNSDDAAYYGTIRLVTDEGVVKEFSYFGNSTYSFAVDTLARVEFIPYFTTTSDYSSYKGEVAYHIYK